MTIRKKLLISAAALSLGLGAFGVHASPDMQRGQQRHEQMQKHMEKRIDDLHAKLKLNAEQEKAWNAYVSAMKPGQGANQHRPSREEIANLSAPQRMEKMHERMKQREQAMGHRVAATHDFYAVLTPGQRKVFDDNFVMGHARHGKHEGGKR
ncbi:MAG TPA: Spy/CpxP family protein refolding chaperone [Noviherbaspirillum sp.]